MKFQFGVIVTDKMPYFLANHEDENETFEIAKQNAKDTEFFERIKDDTKHELLKDKIIDRVRHRQSVSDEVITRVQFIDTLEKKDKEIFALRQEVTSLKQELLTVKSRNKKLCNILGQGESEFTIFFSFSQLLFWLSVKTIVNLT